MAHLKTLSKLTSLTLDNNVSYSLFRTTLMELSSTTTFKDCCCLKKLPMYCTFIQCKPGRGLISTGENALSMTNNNIR